MWVDGFFTGMLGGAVVIGIVLYLKLTEEKQSMFDIWAFIKAVLFVVLFFAVLLFMFVVVIPILGLLIYPFIVVVCIGIVYATLSR